MSHANPMTEEEKDHLISFGFGALVGVLTTTAVAVGIAFYKRSRDGVYPYPVGNRPPPMATNVGTTDYKGVPITTYQVPGYGWAGFFVWKGPGLRPGGIQDGQPRAGWWYDSQGEALKDLYPDVDDMLKARAGVGAGRHGLSEGTKVTSYDGYRHPLLAMQSY